MHPLKLAAAAAVLALSMGAAPSAHAALGLDLSTGGTAEPCGPQCASGLTVGWTFSLASAVRVDGLGVWDADADGLGVDVEVGLWNAAGSLLASTTITPGSTPLASAHPGGRWLTQTVPSLTLGAGNYVIGSVFFEDSPEGQVNPSFTTAAALTLGKPVWNLVTSGLAMPATDFPGDASVFGPTLLLSPVPEPQSIALLVSGLGVLGLMGRRRREPTGA